jgi:hypothetical protein
MQKGLIIIAAMSAIFVLCDRAKASHVLGGTWSEGSIAKHCKAAGGVRTGGAGKTYGCMVPGGGEVTCSSATHKCVGTDPARLAPAKIKHPVKRTTPIKVTKPVKEPYQNRNISKVSVHHATERHK